METRTPQKPGLRAWAMENPYYTAIIVLFTVMFALPLTVGLAIELANKPSQVSEQTVKDNTEATNKNGKSAQRKLDGLTKQVESLQALSGHATGNKPSDFVGTWTSNNFKLVIRKDGTGTFEMAKNYFEICRANANHCMDDSVKRGRSGNVKLLPMKKVGQMMIRLTAKSKLEKPHDWPIETYVITKTGDNRMVVLTGNITGRVMYSGCNTAITTGLSWGCPPKP